MDLNTLLASLAWPMVMVDQLTQDNPQPPPALIPGHPGFLMEHLNTLILLPTKLQCSTLQQLLQLWLPRLQQLQPSLLQLLQQIQPSQLQVLQDIQQHQLLQDILQLQVAAVSSSQTQRLEPGSLRELAMVLRKRRMQDLETREDEVEEAEEEDMVEEETTEATPEDEEIIVVTEVIEGNTVEIEEDTEVIVEEESEDNMRIEETIVLVEVVDEEEAIEGVVDLVEEVRAMAIVNRFDQQLQ